MSKSEFPIESSKADMTDALTDILSSVRMQGSIFSRAALARPWGVESGQFATGIFHAVVRGRMYARLAGESDAVEVARGDVILMPHGSNHLLSSHPHAPTRLIGDLTTTDHQGMGHLVVEGREPTTSLICGSVSFESGSVHPIFSLLPPMIHISDASDRFSGAIETLIQLIAGEIDRGEPGTETVVARLTDTLIVYVLRAYINQLTPGEGGWLGGLRDARIATALGHIHRTPENAWTVQQLAAQSGMSRSAFFSTFKELIGETPIEYLTRWRIHIACRLLRHSGQSVAQTAERVGYATEAGFSNAFTRMMGVRPGSYRRGPQIARSTPDLIIAERQTGARLAPLNRTTVR